MLLARHARVGLVCSLSPTAASADAAERRQPAGAEEERRQQAGAAADRGEHPTERDAGHVFFKTNHPLD